MCESARRERRVPNPACCGYVKAVCFASSPAEGVCEGGTVGENEFQAQYARQRVVTRNDGERARVLLEIKSGGTRARTSRGCATAILFEWRKQQPKWTKNTNIHRQRARNAPKVSYQTCARTHLHPYALSLVRNDIRHHVSGIVPDTC